MPGMDYINTGNDFDAFDPGSAGIIPPHTDVLKSQMDGIIKKMGSFEKTLSSLQRHFQQTQQTVNQIQSQSAVDDSFITQHDLSDFSNKLDVKMNLKNKDIEILRNEVDKLKLQNSNLSNLLRQRPKTPIKIIDPDIQDIKNVQR